MVKKGKRKFNSCLFFSFFAVCAPYQSLHAKVFRNAYVSFELPQKWQCNIEGTEWVCSSTFRQQSREAVIILTAKEAGPSDNVLAYEEHLSKPRLLPGQKAATQSKVLHVRQRKIGNHTWIDGMHDGSEIPNYFTRYLATVKDRLAILVTFSAHKSHFTKYSSDFFQAIDSLNVVAPKAIVQDPSQAPSASTTETFGAPAGDIPISLDDDIIGEADGADRSTKARAITLGAIVLAALGIYLFIKKRQKKR